MTCIIGVVKKSKVYIGGDSCSGSIYTRNLEKNPKVFRKQTIDKEDIIIGGTSSWRMLQLLEFNLDCPKSKRIKPLDYLIKHLIPEIRKVFKEEGYSNISDNKESGGNFLIAFRKRLFEVQHNFSVLESSENMMAVGCGESIARGVMLALWSFEPKIRIKRALEITAQCCPGVGGKMVILESK